MKAVINSKTKTDERYVYKYEIDIVEGEEVLCSFISVCRSAEVDSACELMITSCQEEINRQGQPE